MINVISKNYFFKILLLLSFIQFTKADTKLLMLTDKKCMYCIVWEKQIGKYIIKLKFLAPIS